MIDYEVDGREAALADMCEWFHNNPQQYVESFKHQPFSNNRKAVIAKVKAIKQVTRVRMAWRKELSNRLRLVDEDIVRATNTIIEMIERELIHGGTVRLTNFGDLKTFKFPGGRQVRFRADEKWVRLLNEPLYKAEIGLKR